MYGWFCAALNLMFRPYHKYQDWQNARQNRKNLKQWNEDRQQRR